MKQATTNRLLAGVMSTAATALLLASGVLVGRAWPAMHAAAGRNQPTTANLVRECQLVANRFGFSTVISENGVNVTLPAQQLEDPRAVFDRATAVVAACDGLQMEGFCAGNACGASSLLMVMRRH